MEISEHALRAMVREVDDQHHDGLHSMQSDVRELHAEMRHLRGDSRRGFLTKAGVGAAAITIGSTVLPFSKLISPVAAQELTDGDIAAFAESVELAAVEAYKAAAGSGKVKTKAVGEAAGLFATHHQAHAEAFGGASGGMAKGKPNAKLLEVVGGQLQSAADEKAVIQIAYDLENGAAATYLFALGALKSQAALSLTASILPVESQHAVVLGSVLGKSGKDLFPAGGENNAFQTKEGALDPAQFPVA